MATTIFFTETKNFKLIKSRISNIEDDFLVYLYADTSNLKIPKDIIKELPIVGNELVWIDTAGFDPSQLSNHIVFMIGQFMQLDEPVEFYIATKTARYAKVVELLQSQGVLIDLILPDEPSQVKKTSRRGRPRKTESQSTEQKPKRWPGRPRKDSTATVAADSKPKRGPGRPKKSDTPVKAKKTEKTRKPREEKPISDEQINEKLQRFPTSDANVEQIQKALFGLGKVKRPKIDSKLTDMIKELLGEGDQEAASIIDQLKATGMLDNSGKGGRIKYQD